MLRRKWQENITMRMLLGVCIFLAIYQMYTYAVKSYQDYQINQQIRQGEAEITQLEQDNRHMQEYLKYLDTEAYKEKEAKRIKNVKNPNEDVFIIRNQGLEKVDSAQNQQINSWLALSNPERWWKFFLR
ncbi:MAG: septum formation initiator family protein [Candidatus Abawacabacteria bacterium]|nr:septum formation initiator family protein [Candidatus Abawacabacteria bacterium]